jgi:hypothetical protein
MIIEIPVRIMKHQIMDNEMIGYSRDHNEATENGNLYH